MVDAPLPSIPAETIQRLEDTSKATHFFFWLLAFLFIGSMVWGAVGTLAVMSQAEGEVAPSQRVHMVQHLEGGIIREILVKEGDAVTKDQPLIILESTASSADLGELRLRIASLSVDMIRMEAEANQQDKLVFPDTMMRDHKDLVENAQAVFQSRRDAYLSALTTQKLVIEQKQHEIEATEARIKSNKIRLDHSREQLSIMTELRKSQLSSRLEQLNLLKETNTLEGQIQEDKSVLERTRAALAQAKNGSEQIVNDFQEKARAKLEETRRQLDEFSERLNKFEDHVRRTTLRAPATGIIKVIHVRNEGGVVSPGGTVMEIVPKGDHVVIEAKLLPQEVGFVAAGQRAIIQLASNDAGYLGKIEGTVELISPDSLVTPQGISYFKVRLVTHQTAFIKNNIHYPLIPGVKVMVGIVTGERTVLEYLFASYLSTHGLAMTER
ncbi:MAG: HlyD family type I secretion periplasmic adaptor subunit [Magnetococcales bacterium]|nr:HlyD family type I secretion periplasmic adaptor subunit [Magnetococcales bacterium]NGZ25706.1 HlyD family type I secretion periplasmic adaptor subunit [Magnetococcales bacterium]